MTESHWARCPGARGSHPGFRRKDGDGTSSDVRIGLLDPRIRERGRYLLLWGCLPAQRLGALLVPIANILVRLQGKAIPRQLNRERLPGRGVLEVPVLQAVLDVGVVFLGVEQDVYAHPAHESLGGQGGYRRGSKVVLCRLEAVLAPEHLPHVRNRSGRFG